MVPFNYSTSTSTSAPATATRFGPFSWQRMQPKL